MFLIKVFNFLKGYVIIQIKGCYVERFINVCTHRNIYIWDTIRRSDNTLLLKISIKSFSKIRPVAKKTKTRVKILEKKGLPIIINKYRKRYLFFAGILCFLVFAFVSTQFIWTVEVPDNTEYVSKDEIMQAAFDSGLKVGVFKRNINEKDLQNQMLYKLDKLSWTWTYIKGTKAIIEVKEKTPKPQVVDNSVPCHIVAEKDAVVTTVRALNGFANVKPGDTVLRGDILISGTALSEVAGMRFVHASGEVYARTWAEKTADFPMYKITQTPTGKTKNYYTFNIWSKKIPLYFKKKSPFKNYYNVSNRKEPQLGKDNFIGISIDIDKYIEIVNEKTPLTYEQTLNYAENELRKELLKNAGENAVLEDLNISVGQKDEEIITVTATAQFNEQIGIQTPVDMTENTENISE